MALLNFKYGLQASLPAFADASEGNVYVTTDKSEMFIKLPGQTDYVNMGDFQLVEYASSTTALKALGNLASSLKRKNILYLAVCTTSGSESTAMYRYNGSSFVTISNTAEIASLQKSITTLTTKLNDLTATVNGKAPKAHASTETTYGTGTDAKYGHLKLSASTSSDSGVSGGIAATPSAVKAAKSAADVAASAASGAQGTADSALSKANTNATAISNLTTTVGGKAPIKHDSADTTYGVGTGSNYGHLKLSDTASSSNDTTKGIAATPKAVQTVATAASNAQTKADSAYTLAEKANTAATTNATAIADLKEADTALDGQIDGAVSRIDALETDVETLTTNVSNLSTNKADKSTVTALDEAYKAADTEIKTSITNLTTTVNGKAPKAHAVDANTYGLGTNGVFGHVKLSDSTSSSSGQTAGVAATPAAVKAVADAKADKTTVEALDEAYKAADTAINSTITTLKNSIGNLSNIMNFRGKVSALSEVTSPQVGDVVVVGNKEYVYGPTTVGGTTNDWVEIGDVNAQATAITNLQNTVGSKPSSPTMDPTLWEEVADLRSDLGESTASAGAGSAFARIKQLETWKSTHETAYSALAGRVSTNETAITNLTTLLTWGTF